MLRPSDVFRPLDQSLPLFFRLHKLVFFTMAVFVVMNVIISCIYSYIYSNTLTIEEVQIYKEGDWQYCLGQSGSYFTTAIVNQCVQTIIFGSLTLVIVLRAFNHEEWLPSSISFVIYTMFGAFCYFPMSPIVPFPSKTVSSIVSLTAFIHPEMYKDYENCGKAYNLNAFFLVVQYVIGFLIFVLFIFSIVAEVVRQVSPKPDHGPQLTGIKFPLLIAIISFFSFFIGLIARGHASTVILDVLKENSDTPQFPFSVSSLEASTIFLVTSSMGVFRGNTLHSVSAFRLSFITAIAYVVLLYPTVISSAKLFRLFRLWNQPQCYDFFMSSSFWSDSDIPSPFYSPPDVSEHNARQLCQDSRVSFVSALISFFLMQFQAVFCGYVFFKNRHNFKVDDNSSTQSLLQPELQ